MFKSSYFEKMQCRHTPLLEASSGQQQYYITSAWHLQSYIRLAWHLEEMQLRRCRYTLPVEVSGGQEQYYIRSSWHSEEWRMQMRMQWTVRCTPQYRHLVARRSTTFSQLYICLLISCLAVVEVSHTLEYA